MKKSSKIHLFIINYSTGCMGILWAIVWFLVVKNSPAEDPNISEEERLYIETSLANDDQKKVIVEDKFFV